MRLKAALFGLLLTLCPFALCYGQLSFSSVHGENGYSAVRGAYVWDLDNGLVLTPIYRFFTVTDDDLEDGVVSRYALESSYELNDDWDLFATGFIEPKALGDWATGYRAGTTWKPFYYWHGIKNPFVRLWAGQTFYRTYVTSTGIPLDIYSQGQMHVFKQRDVFAAVDGGFDFYQWNIKAMYHKVLKYEKEVPAYVSFGWADLPYMTAIIQGFIAQALATRISYRTDFISPYAGIVQYRYLDRGKSAAAVMAGLDIKLWDVAFLGGVEIFEPRREENRRVFFTFTAEVHF